MGGVFAELCDCVDIVECAVDGRTPGVALEPLRPGDIQEPSIESTEDVLPIPGPLAEYAKSACAGLKQYDSTDGNCIRLLVRCMPGAMSERLGAVPGRCSETSYGLGYGLTA